MFSFCWQGFDVGGNSGYYQHDATGDTAEPYVHDQRGEMVVMRDDETEHYITHYCRTVQGNTPGPGKDSIQTSMIKMIFDNFGQKDC